jgi:hypothetical protein
MFWNIKKVSSGRDNDSEAKEIPNNERVAKKVNMLRKPCLQKQFNINGTGNRDESEPEDRKVIPHFLFSLVDFRSFFYLNFNPK